MHDRWAARRRRVNQLAGHPHARAMLETYRAVLEAQEPLFRDAALEDASSWLASRARPLREGMLVPHFRQFIASLAPRTTTSIHSVAESLAAASAETLTSLLWVTLERGEVSEIARGGNWEPAPLEFFARAFLQPLAERAAESDAGERRSGGTHCRRCGWPPQVAFLRDDPDAKGARLLVCALCASEWGYPRVVCVNCEEKAPAALSTHEQDEAPHVRIETCESCRGYIKSVDLRLEGHAVPVVDDIATVTLDLWADEHGYWKVQRNLVGL